MIPYTKGWVYMPQQSSLNCDRLRVVSNAFMYVFVYTPMLGANLLCYRSQTLNKSVVEGTQLSFLPLTNHDSGYNISTSWNENLPGNRGGIWWRSLAGAEDLVVSTLLFLIFSWFFGAFLNTLTTRATFASLAGGTKRTNLTRPIQTSSNDTFGMPNVMLMRRLPPPHPVDN